MLGTITYFNTTRGFGWLESGDVADGIFLHACDLGPEFGPHGKRQPMLATKCSLSWKSRWTAVAFEQGWW
jgi:hypothetical protein